MDALYSAFFILIIAGIVIGVIRFKNLDKTAWRYFPIYLWAILFLEIIASIPPYFKFSNHIIYNLTVLLELIGFTYFFYNSSIYKRSKKLIISSCSIALSALIISLVWIEPNFLIFQSFFSFIASLSIFIIVGIYFFDMIKSQVLDNIIRRIEFWVASGILVYQAGQIPFSVVQNFYESMSDASYLILLQETLQYSSIIMYGLFTLGLYTCKKM